MTRPCAPAAERNGAAILAVLKVELAAGGTVLEIGSGTGQHAALFARHLPDVKWQPSDLAQNIDGIGAWVADAALSNILDPLVIDVLAPPGGVTGFDAVFSANTAHIMHVEAVRALFMLAGIALRPGGLFALYGPMRRHGRYNTDSNATFDRALRQKDPGMGIRDIEMLDTMASNGNMDRLRYYAMPANNQLSIWQKSGDDR